MKLKSRAEAEKQTYGGTYKRPYDPSKCAEKVRDEGRWPSYHQCTRKPGFGPYGIYCKQHDPAEEARRALERNQKWDKQWQYQQRQARLANAAAALLDLLKESQTDIGGDWRERRDELLRRIEGKRRTASSHAG